MKYRIELQQPYGTLVQAWEANSAQQAARRFVQALRMRTVGAFIPVLLNGKEISPSELRSQRHDTRRD